MARGINKVILVGHLGQDPDVRTMPSGGTVANMTLATSEAWKDKQTGENQERTEWHRLVLFNRQAEVAGQYLRKGSQIYVEGSLKTRKWTDKNEQERYTTEVTVNQFQMLDRKGTDLSQQVPTGGPAQHSAPAAPEPAAMTLNDDDIPF